jgi:hypothetical protein
MAGARAPAVSFRARPGGSSPGGAMPRVNKLWAFSWGTRPACGGSIPPPYGSFKLRVALARSS